MPHSFIYSVQTQTVIALQLPNGLSESGETLEEIRTRYPDAAVGTSKSALEAIEATYIEPPKEIDWTTFVEMLEVLPPLNWVKRKDSESFMSSELYYGRVTWTYVRLGDRYFRLRDRVSLTHEELVARCAPLNAALDAAG